MTTNPTLLALLVAVSWATLAQNAVAAETVTCPAVFPMTALRFVAEDQGWSPGPGERAPSLVGWGLDSGPPARLAALIPSGQGKGSFSWKLEGPFPDGVWVRCLYADGALTLTRRLAATTGVCTAPSKKTGASKPQPVSFVCR